MIICSDEELQIGAIVPGFIFGNDQNSTRIFHAEQPFYVVRAATLSEWLADCAARLGPPPSSFVPPPGHFYKISTD